jgi:hypothetical protein
MTLGMLPGGRRVRKQRHKPGPKQRHEPVQKRVTHGVTGAALLLWALACTIAPAPETGLASSGPRALPPPGFGTLLQDQVTISLASRGLEIKVTPLEESVIRVTAPDTYERLSGVALSHREAAAPGSKLFLVSFFSDQPNLRFIPEELQLISRGLRARPLLIMPITPTWGQRRVRQREMEMAVYAFSSEIDLEADIVLAYGLDQTSQWSGILPRIQSERGRARARAGVGGSRF